MFLFINALWCSLTVNKPYGRRNVLIYLSGHCISWDLNGPISDYASNLASQEVTYKTSLTCKAGMVTAD